jgi:hypothetical protein
MAVYQSSGVSANATQITKLNQDLLNNVTQLSTADTVLKNRLDVVQGDDSVVGSLLKATKDVRLSLEASIQNLNDVAIATLQNNQDLLLADSETVGSIAYKFKQLTGTAPEILDTLGELATSINDDPNFSQTVTNLIVTKVGELKTELQDGVSSDLDTMKEIADKISTIYTEITNLISSTASTVLDDAKAYSDANSPFPINSLLPIDSDNKITLEYPAIGKVVSFGMAYVDNPENHNNLDLMTCMYDVDADNTAFEGKKFKIYGDVDVSYEGRNAKVHYLTKTSNTL